jgi:hypothetical protein
MEPNLITFWSASKNRLSPAALQLFLRIFHSPKPIYRLNATSSSGSGEEPDMEAASGELVDKGLLRDVVTMGSDGEAALLMVSGRCGEENK